MPGDGSKVTTRAAAKTDNENTSEVSVSLKLMDSKLDSILGILDKNSTDITEIKKEQKDLGSSIELCHSSINDVKVMLSEHEKKIKNCNDDIELIKKENILLNTNVKNLKCEINELEQYSHRNNLVIYGVPEEKGENISGVMRRLAKAIQFPDWSDSLLDAVHRMGQVSSRNPRPIIAKFISRINKEDFLSKRKVRRNLKASDMGYSSENPIYVNESMTSANRELLKLTREAAKKKNYDQVWTANCNIYVRRERGKAPIIKIKTVQDINNL